MKAHEAILHSQMMMIKNSTFRAYQIGDRVWLDARNLKTTHPTHKLRAKRYGPFKVTNALSHVAYQLQLPASWKIHNVFHASYLSSYKETIEHGSNFVEPPPDIIEGQPEWEVEAIVGMRLFGKRKQKQYRVHWRGYPHANNTWKPEDNIHTPKLIAEYLQSQEMVIRATRGGSRVSMPITRPRTVALPRDSIPYEPPLEVKQTPPEKAEVQGDYFTSAVPYTLKYQLDQVIKTGKDKPKIILTQEEERREVRTSTTDEPMGTETKDGSTQISNSPRREPSQQPTIHSRDNYPRNTDEAIQTNKLL
jgi:Chromo (CHRromatin Organisation MOdifier) domain